MNNRKLLKTASILFIVCLVVVSIFSFLKDDLDDASVAGANEIFINPGDDINQIFNQNRNGNTKFIIKAGTHFVDEPINPAKGDIVEGEIGAVLSGAKLLESTGFKQTSGGRWYIESQTQELAPHPAGFRGSVPGGSSSGYACQESYTRCNYREELFVNDARFRHANNLNEVGNNDKWFFDYPANRIYIGFNPSGKKIETSVSEAAFRATNSNVVIRNLIVEKFAVRAQSSAIEIIGANGIIEFNEIRLNNGGGASVKSNGIIQNNYIHNQGQNGFKSVSSNGVIVRNNKIEFNNRSGFEYYWEAGGSKFARTENLLLQNNFVNNNFGSGLWADIDNINTVYDGNIITNNFKNGIQHEISFDAVIKNNYVANNANPEQTFFSNVYIQNSSGVEVFDNTIISHKDYGRGIWAYTASRGTSSRFPGRIWTTKDNSYTNNQIYYASTQAYAAGLDSVTTASERSFDDVKGSNKFDYNTYYVEPNRRNWTWDVSKTFAEFKQLGQEANGKTVAYVTPPAAPEWNVTVGPTGTSDSGSTNIQTPFAGKISIPGKIEVENYDLGGQDVAFNELGSQNLAGSTYRNDPVDIKDIENEGKVVGHMQTGEWLEYSINVTKSTKYSLQVRGSSADNNLFGVAIGNQELGSFSIPNSGSYNNLAILDLGEFELEAGPNILRLTVLDQWLDLDYLEFIEIEDAPICGDAQVTGAEVCDDGNQNNGDQCSSDCTNLCNSPEIWNGSVCESPFQAEISDSIINIQAENYDIGGQGVGYNELSAGNSESSSYRNDDVDIKDAEDGNRVIGHMQTGEWLRYSLNGVSAGEYIVVVGASTKQNDARISFSINGGEKKVYTLSNTTQYENILENIFAEDTITLEAGNIVLTVTVENQFFDLDFIRLEKVEFVEPVCGNGRVENGEQCDDGNTESGDGCTSQCQNEEVPTESGIVCGAIDINQDLKLDILDLISFVEVFNKSCLDSPYETPLSQSSCGGKDTNSDSIVNLLDLIYFITLFNQPSCTL